MALTPGGWLWNQLASKAGRRVWSPLWRAVAGARSEAPLAAIAEDALREAVREQLPADAGADVEDGIFDIFNNTWPLIDEDLTFPGPVMFGGQVVIPGGPGSDERGWHLLADVRRVVQGALAVAAAPYDDGETESSLDLIRSDYGVDIDTERFAATFARSWATGVVLHARHEGSPLDPLSRDLQFELLTAELSENVRGAVDGAPLDPAVAAEDRARRWFAEHVEPIDAAMRELRDNYKAGFSAAAVALRSGEGLPEAVDVLRQYREARITGPLHIKGVLKAFVDGAPLLDETTRSAFADYAGAADEFFFFKAEDHGVQTWFTTFIVEFEDLQSTGRDPLDGSQYKAFVHDGDPFAALARTLPGITREIDKAWAAYETAYKTLQLRCY